MLDPPPPKKKGTEVVCTFNQGGSKSVKITTPDESIVSISLLTVRERNLTRIRRYFRFYTTLKNLVLPLIMFNLSPLFVHGFDS